MPISPRSSRLLKRKAASTTAATHDYAALARQLADLQDRLARAEARIAVLETGYTSPMWRQSPTLPPRDDAPWQPPNCPGWPLPAHPDSVPTTPTMPYGNPYPPLVVTCGVSHPPPDHPCHEKAAESIFGGAK